MLKPTFSLAALTLSLTAHTAVMFAAGTSGGAHHSAPGGNLMSVVFLSPAKNDSEFRERFGAQNTEGKSPVDEMQSPGGAEPVADLPSEMHPPSMEPRNASVNDKVMLPLLAESEPQYFRGNELTERPRVLQDVPSDLTFALPDAPTQPTVLRLMINEQGTVDRVILEDSDLTESVESFLIDAFSRIRFKPGQIGGASVKSQMRIEVKLVSDQSAIPAVAATSPTAELAAFVAQESAKSAPVAGPAP